MFRRFIPLLLLFLCVLTAFHRPGVATLRLAGGDTAQPSYMRARDFKGKSVTSASGVLQLTTGLQNDMYQLDSTGRSGDYYVEVSLGKLLNLPEKRTPLNISIVIDRSGSMQGVKMGYAKKAAKSLIDRLQAEDYVSVVMYDNSIDSVQEPVPAVNKNEIKARIDRITPRGSTNLWGSTEKGYEFVRRHYRSGCVNRVLLISDGLANTGMTDSSQIHRNVQRYKDDEGISLSTFGVGLDYNETLMTDMAETGAGNYYFIDSPDNMMKQFDQEMSGLLNVVAQDAVLEIDLPHGVQVAKGYPLQYKQSGSRVTVRLRDLFAEDTRSTWFHFTLADGIAAPLNFDCTLRYVDVLDGKEKTTSNRNVLVPVRTLDAYLTHFNKPVVQQVILFTVNQNMEQIGRAHV